MVDAIMSSIGWFVCIFLASFVIYSVLYFHTKILKLEGRIEDLEEEGEEYENRCND